MHRERRTEGADGDLPPSDDAIEDDQPLDEVDEAGLESFPASDPPAH